jgi:hypothetical protein
MEKHFLEDQVQGEPEFKAEPWYNRYGDCIVYQIADEAVVADRVDEVLTIYRSALDNRPIGFQMKGVGAIVKAFNLQGLAVCSSTDTQGSRLISVATLLLAAYDKSPRTAECFLAYASAINCASERHALPVSELQPA